jgi:hypothetical protein
MEEINLALIEKIRNKQFEPREILGNEVKIRGSG